MSFHSERNESKMKKVHLVCNAHIDPVWLWQWEEGAAEAISTFRVAADFCEKYDGFVFNHNEAILYKWIEEYEPELFHQIQALVKAGKWHIMGGWFLQPDCNMPNGESIIRQIAIGKNYFKEKFGVEPKTAINFDSFGHSRGLVQILKKSGYDSYIVCRPAKGVQDINDSDFIWTGYEGSEIVVHRSDENYNSVRGKAAKELEEWLEANKDKELGLFLWGIGNHGGGPSKIDLDNIEAFMLKEKEQCEIVHSLPESYFEELRKSEVQLTKVDRGLNPIADGCYTSQIRVKQKHRALENEIYSAEKMCSSASLQGFMSYPTKELKEAICDLMTAEFHDALPGSAIKDVEEDTLRILNHGLEITSRLKAKAFFALSSGQEKVIDGETPLLIYNPHPFKVKGIFECEFVLPSQNWSDEYYYPMLYQNHKEILCQPELEYSNFRMDWRKRVAFFAQLEPSQMNRFDFKFKILPKKPEVNLKKEKNYITFKTEDLEVGINCSTGFIDRYVVDKFNYVKENAFMPLVMKDCYNSWGVGFDRFEDVLGEFKLMTEEESAEFSGVKESKLEALRVIEDGEVRTVIEAVFKYNKSFICQLYKLPKHGTEIQVEVKVYWNEKDKLLKLSVPSALEASTYFGETMFGHEELNANGKEVVAQKWNAIVSDNEGRSFSCINDGTYGSNFKAGEARFTLLRSAGYSTTDFLGRIALAKDRFTPRMDQGERVFSFWFNGGEKEERLRELNKEAMLHNEKPYMVSFCPSGKGTNPKELVVLSNSTVNMSAFKKAENSKDYIIRLFETTGREQSTKINIPAYKIEQNIILNPFEIKTLKLDISKNSLVEAAILD